MAKMPDPYWHMTYQADRRKHRHRCVVCRRILEPGDEVGMVRVSHRKTKAAHDYCLSKSVSVDGYGTWTFADSFRFWGLEYLANTGYRDAAAALLDEMRARPDYR